MIKTLTRFFFLAAALAWFIFITLGMCASCRAQEFPQDTYGDKKPVETIETMPPPSETIPPPKPDVPSPATIIPSPVTPSLPPSDYQVVPGEPFEGVPGDSIQISADNVRTTFQESCPVLSIAEGNVTALYREFAITADYGTVDYITDIAVFTGNVVFKTGHLEVLGERVSLDLNTGQWSFINARSDITPEFSRGNLCAPVFSDAEEISGLKQREATLHSGNATTCNLSSPHYELTSRSILILPGRKIVLTDTSFYALGRRLVTFRRFVIPLRYAERNTKIVPKFGYTVEEGYYAKFAYPVIGDRSQTGIVSLDIMSNKGIGPSTEYRYQIGRTAGTLIGSYIFDRNIRENTLNWHYRHSQPLGTFNLVLNSDARTNSYQYAPNSRSYIHQLTLTRDRDMSDTSLVINNTINNTFAKTQRISGNLVHRQRFGEDMNWDTRFDYTGFTTDRTSARLTSETAFTRRESSFDWTLSARKLNDLSDEAFVGRGLFGGIEKLPELALSSDTERLGRILPFGIPANFDLSYGRFAELPADTNLGRTYLSIDTPVQLVPITTTWSLATGAGFRQYMYTNGTAQYAWDASAELKKKISSESDFRLTYRYQRPKGYTPFRFDYVGRYNITNASLNLKNGDRFKLSLLTGYNFEREKQPWQDVTLRFSVQPSENFLFYTATGFDINNSRWRTLINQVRLRWGDCFRLDIGTRYDPTRERLANAKIQLDTPIGSKWRLEALAGWNGFTNEFDYRSVRITRDLHCWEASLVYVDQNGFYREQGIRFYLRIKAFPLFENFGMGQFGQTLDTSVGQVY